MKRIYLPDFDKSQHYQVYAGHRPRWATASAVSIIGDRILVASYLNKKIFLLEEDGTIVSEINTTNFPDLMDHKDGKIATTERTPYSQGCTIGHYRLNDDKVEHVRDEQSSYTQLHGIRINNGLIMTNTDNVERVVVMKDNIFNQFEYYPKDIFLIPGYILITTSDKRPDIHKAVDTTWSMLYLFTYPELRLVSSIRFRGQTDCICYDNGVGFVTLQAQDSLQKFKLVDNTLIDDGMMGGFFFPHGCALKDGRLFVTEYGTNSVAIVEI